LYILNTPGFFGILKKGGRKMKLPDIISWIEKKPAANWAILMAVAMFGLAVFLGLALRS
jgi:hypothetical protein